MDKILLFIPCYNCEKQIKRVMKRLNSKVMQYISEIIIVNNRSNDNTEEVIIEYVKNHDDLPVKILCNCDNYNLGGSHKVAFKYAKENGFNYVIVLHGDDQANIQDLLPVLQNNIYKEHDCCLGSRFQIGSTINGYSKFRIFGNIIFNMVFSILLGKKIYDLGSGLNMYKTEILENNFYIKFPDSLTFNYCMIMAADYYKHNITFFPISWREEDQISNVKMINQAFTTLLMLFKYVINKEKFIKSELRTTTIEEYKSDKIEIKELTK